MNLQDFKQHISNFPNGTQFKFGITEPFSWRGSYDEVAFSIVESPMSKEDILKNIERAYSETFYGYKGGEYQYDDDTNVNFEEYGSRNYTSGRYVAEMIAKIENADTYQSQEERLIKIAFS